MDSKHQKSPRSPIWSLYEICVVFLLAFTGYTLYLSRPLHYQIDKLQVADLKKPYPQEAQEQYNFLKHGGGLAPFIPHQGYGISPEVPPGCEVDQVHLLARHGERFPSAGDGRNQKNVISNLQSIEFKNNKGPLAFLKDYEYFAADSDFEQLSTTGVYSGAYDAFSQGEDFRKCYGHLYDTDDKFPIFAASDKRVVDTAKNFGRGFLGSEYDSKVALQVIPETRPQGANTLAPSTFCKTYDRSMNNHLINEFPKTYLLEAAARLEKLSPDYAGQLKPEYLYHMMSICAFELNTRGSSEFCDLFTENEWINFSYHRDLVYYYQASFGHSKSLGIGSNYLNATTTLLQQNELRQKIFPSFTHDTDITPVLVPLGLFDDGRKLPTGGVDFNSLFKSSQIVPMGARLVIERLKAEDNYYVRIKVGGSVIPMPNCTSGPGFSCELREFLEIMDKRLDGTTYLNTCETDKDLPQHLSFFWDWENKDYSA